MNPDVECPGPDCWLCNGQACALCGAGSSRHNPFVDPPCEHDCIERHTEPDGSFWHGGTRSKASS